MSPDAPSSLTAGICATGGPEGIGQLVRRIVSESDSSGSALNGLVVVASDLRSSQILELREAQASDSRIEVIEEKERHGKADAINQIIRRSRGDYLLLVNSDAHPEPGAISEVIRSIREDSGVGVVSAKPIPVDAMGMAGSLSEFMWTAHNTCSLTLNHMNKSNHSSDELIIVRRSAIARLPRGLVNDGAFMAAIARLRGFSVKFSEKAHVRVETPGTLIAAIRQRRRILFGHFEVWRITGSMPKTIESMAIIQPSVGLGLLVRTIARKPRFIMTLPVALTCEGLAAVLSIWDAVTATNRHSVWRR